MAFCFNCGTSLKEGAVFCHECGSRFETVQGSAQPAVKATQPLPPTSGGVNIPPQPPPPAIPPTISGATQPPPPP